MCIKLWNLRDFFIKCKHTVFSGRGWFRKFQERHPQLTQRVAAKLNKNQADVSKEGLLEWFQDAEEYIRNGWKSRGCPGLLEDPTRIFNCDETGFALDAQTGKKTR